MTIVAAALVLAAAAAAAAWIIGICMFDVVRMKLTPALIYISLYIYILYHIIIYIYYNA